MDSTGPLGVLLLPLLLMGTALGNGAQKAPGSPSAPSVGNNAEICLLPPDVGPCRARIPSYYYDRYTQSCRIFFYGGCEGNANNFDTLEDCNEACSRIERPSYCYSPKDEGLCSANVTRYYFNPRHTACETFTYTGCGGNDNNFLNMEDCTRVCVKGSRKEKNMKLLKTVFPGRRLKTYKK
ncbi:tissue factor pathway inhibitor 2 isoform X3 [Ursus americanus]|uniref:Tissue factor pathway inhibitor 2 isoform X3 n=1 Tax=Ursus maritimus TaxID=29073 RepID=A0A384BPF5_URSMA|nr:tissue factor pathway inhibitor 2 isoform X3 [Ursus maritimus]XP_045649197.1 tissue factor pathway inhibitor 2 isoform X3 [Ursus americanus]XP_057160437.1 tissue factor pathway inhibitor 2 isoform X3 [Ursus arctos]XP_057160438.1 tissue factor pathway inhibitor 2 isoform X3 [Ursus arctos]